MSTLPTSFRYPVNIHGKADPDVVDAINYHDDAITDLQQAIPLLKAQIDAGTTGTASTGNTTQEVVSTENTIITQATIGFLNDQTGNITYTTQQSDYGGFILFSDASAIAVALGVGPVITLPWFCVILNQGAGLVTLTPNSGTISYPNNIGAATMTIPQGLGAVLVFDGTNFDALIYPVPPENTPAVAHEWLAGYNSVTGAFSQTQPAFSDISGQITSSQLPTGLFSGTIVTAQLTPTGAQGSMTFLSGSLQSQTPAT